MFDPFGWRSSDDEPDTPSHIAVATPALPEVPDIPEEPDVPDVHNGSDETDTPDETDSNITNDDFTDEPGGTTDNTDTQQATTDTAVSYTNADVVGFWQAEWVMRDGSEVIMDIAFGTFGELYMLVGYKHSDALSRVEGDFFVVDNQIHVQGLNYVDFEHYEDIFDFRFVGDKLYLDFGEEHAFTRARIPPYNVYFNVG